MYQFKDLEPELPKTPGYYFDGGRFTDKGSVKMSEVIYPALIQLIEDHPRIKGNMHHVSETRDA